MYICKSVHIGMILASREVQIKVDWQSRIYRGEHISAEASKSALNVTLIEAGTSPELLRRFAIGCDLRLAPNLDDSDRSTSDWA